jgi:hypothetical protein
MIGHSRRPTDKGPELGPGHRLYDLGSILAIVGLISALLTVSGLAYEKHQSDQAIAACYQYRDAIASNVEALRSAGEPGFKIRFAEGQLQAAEAMCARVREGEAVLLDQAGIEATKDALIGLAKGEVFGALDEGFYNDLMSAVDLAFDTTLKVSDAYSNAESGHQTAVRDQMEAIRRRLGEDGRALGGDDLAFYIAATEVRYITERLRDQGVREDDDAYINIVRQYVRDAYLQPGEIPLPSRIAYWFDQIIQIRYSGASQPVEATATAEAVPLAGTITAVGSFDEATMVWSADCPGQRYTSNSVTLSFAALGGEVVGEARVVSECTNAPECGVDQALLVAPLRGQYDASTGNLSGQVVGATGHADIWTYSEEEGCQRQQYTFAFPASSWEAVLEGEYIRGTIDQRTTFALRLQVP